MKKRISLLITLIIISLNLMGCAALSDWSKSTKGQLVGNKYTVYQYDNTGNQTLNFSGNSISISSYQTKLKEDGTKELTGVLDITIDGNQILSVGNTLIFEEFGLDKVLGFDDISEFATDHIQQGIHFIPFDKLVNSVKNSIGKSRTVLIYSQLGEPLAVYQGDKVYVTVPGDLPKMTRLNIDGKSLYLHRVNYTIVDTKLLDN